MSPVGCSAVLGKHHAPICIDVTHLVCEVDDHALHEVIVKCWCVQHDPDAAHRIDLVSHADHGAGEVAPRPADDLA